MASSSFVAADCYEIFDFIRLGSLIGTSVWGFTDRSTASATFHRIQLLLTYQTSLYDLHHDFF